jgi:glycosyltransferase involved in cell wall biosynthesis
MNRKKILVLSHSAANGGAELALKSLVESTSDIFDWSVVYPSAKRQISLSIKGLSNVYYIPLPWWCYEGNDMPTVNKRRLHGNIHTIKRIAKGYDLLLTNTLTIPWLAYISSEIQKPHVWYVHEYGNADHKLNFILGYDESLRIIASKSTKIMTISKNLKEHLSKVIHPENITIIHQAVDLGTYTNIPTKRYNKAPTIDGITIATIAALRPSKGQHLLIDAVYNLQKRGYKTPRIIIRGPNADPQYVDYLNKANKKVKGVDVKIGFVSPDEVLSSADVVFVGSENEALGRGTLEGLASGKLVLGSNTGATSELLAEGRGILFDINNKKSLENAIFRFT